MELSASKLRVLGLMEKTKEVVRFASEEECDRLFAQVASLCQKALAHKRTASEVFSQQSVEGLVEDARSVRKQKLHMCSCDFFGASCLEGIKSMPCCEGEAEQASGGCCITPQEGCKDCTCSISTVVGPLFQLGAEDEYLL